MVHAIGKTTGGGVHHGFASAAYHTGISGRATYDSRIPTPRHSSRQRANRPADFDVMTSLRRRSARQPFQFGKRGVGDTLTKILGILDDAIEPPVNVHA